MTNGEIISICAIVAGPLTAMTISLVVSWLRERRKQKIDLFLTLLSQRKKTPMTEKFVDALNVIDVIFGSNKSIIEAKN
jgi:hypothetical protein